MVEQQPQILLGTLIGLRTDRNQAALSFVAICLWCRGTRSTRADLRASLDMQATAHAVIGDLRTAADERYVDLLEWCIRTTAAFLETADRP